MHAGCQQDFSTFPAYSACTPFQNGKISTAISETAHFCQDYGPKEESLVVFPFVFAESALGIDLHS
jgi:hypothetical protein